MIVIFAAGVIGMVVSGLGGGYLGFKLGYRQGFDDGQVSGIEDGVEQLFQWAGRSGRR